jgi:hypothetical protein
MTTLLAAAMVGIYSSTPTTYGVYMATGCLLLCMASMLALARILRP